MKTTFRVLLIQSILLLSGIAFAELREVKDGKPLVVSTPCEKTVSVDLDFRGDRTKPYKDAPVQVIFQVGNENNIVQIINPPQDVAEIRVPCSYSGPIMVDISACYYRRNGKQLCFEKHIDINAEEGNEGIHRDVPNLGLGRVPVRDPKTGLNLPPGMNDLMIIRLPRSNSDAR
jgi:hypothetical protein